MLDPLPAKLAFGLQRSLQSFLLLLLQCDSVGVGRAGSSCLILYMFGNISREIL